MKCGCCVPPYRQLMALTEDFLTAFLWLLAQNIGVVDVCPWRASRTMRLGPTAFRLDQLLPLFEHRKMCSCWGSTSTRK